MAFFGNEVQINDSNDNFDHYINGKLEIEISHFGCSPKLIKWYQW